MDQIFRRPIATCIHDPPRGRDHRRVRRRERLAQRFRGCMGTATVDQGFGPCADALGTVHLAEAAARKARRSWRRSPRRRTRTPPAWPAANSVGLQPPPAAAAPVENGARDLPALLRDSMDHPVWEPPVPPLLLLRVVRAGLPHLLLLRRARRAALGPEERDADADMDGCLLTDFATVRGGITSARNAPTLSHRYYRKGFTCRGRSTARLPASAAADASALARPASRTRSMSTTACWR